MILTLIFGLLLFFTYGTWNRRGAVAGMFYFVSQVVTLWIIITDRLPWYAIVVLIIMNVYTLSTFPIKSAEADKI